MLDECLDALGKNKALLSEVETAEVFKSFTSMFPITDWGVIDWTEVSNKCIINNLEEIVCIINNRKGNGDKNVFILWNDNSLPSISVNLEDALYVIDDITAVSFDTWLYNAEDMYIVEFHHEGKITIGFA
jgi:hypothetical protein